MAKSVFLQEDQLALIKVHYAQKPSCVFYSNLIPSPVCPCSEIQSIFTYSSLVINAIESATYF